MLLFKIILTQSLLKEVTILLTVVYSSHQILSYSHHCDVN